MDKEITHGYSGLVIREYSDMVSRHAADSRASFEAAMLLVSPEEIMLNTARCLIRIQKMVEMKSTIAACQKEGTSRELATLKRKNLVQIRLLKKRFDDLIAKKRKHNLNVSKMFLTYHKALSKY